MVEKKERRITSYVVNILVVAVLILGTMGMGSFAAKETTVLEYWVWTLKEDTRATLQQVIGDFESLYPDIKVRLQEMPGDVQEFEQKLGLAIAAGKSPDIINASDSMAGHYIAGGHFAPLPDWLIEKWLQKGGGGFPVALEIVSWGEKVMGLPLAMTNMALFYNKDLFKEAGIGAPPETWDELVTYGKKLTKYDKEDAQTQIGFSVRYAGNLLGITHKFLPFLWQLGGYLLDEEGGIAVAAAFNSPAGREAVQFYADLVWEHKISSIEFPAPTDAFGQGISAMHYRGSWLISHLKTVAPHIDFGTAVLPLPKDGRQATTAYMELLAVSSQSSLSEQNAAWTFFDFVSDPEQERMLLIPYGALPLHKVVAEDPYYSDPLMETFVDLVPYGVPFEHSTLMLGPIQMAYGGGIQRALYKSQTVEEALAQAEDEVNKILEEEKS